MAAQDLPAGRILPEGARMAGRETLAHRGPKPIPGLAWLPIGWLPHHVGKVIMPGS